MQTLLIYVFALLVVGGLLFLAASFAFGRDEEMAPALPEGTPVELPDDRPATGADLRALRLAVVLRGYRMEEVDWVLDRLAEQVDSRDREIARLRSVLHVEPMPAPAADGPGRRRRRDRLVRPRLPARGRTRRTGPGRRRADDQAPVRRRGARAGRGRRAAAARRTSRCRRGRPATAPARSPCGTGWRVRVRDPVRGLRPDGAPDRDQR